MAKDSRQSRVYPTCCIAFYCGSSGVECKGCVNKPILDEFKSWVRETGATVSDPIWSPTIYKVPSGKEGVTQ